MIIGNEEKIVESFLRYKKKNGSNFNAKNLFKFIASEVNHSDCCNLSAIEEKTIATVLRRYELGSF